jgi:hypothetical protein
MSRFVIRVWLPDTPGALGRVASAVGSVGASLISIDILEQDGGYAIDELVVDAVDSINAVEKLVVAMTFIEGVNVEDIRENPGDVVDPRLDALETAADMVEQDDASVLLEVLVQRARHDLWADWAVVADFGSDELRVATGDVPSIPWIQAFLAGSRSSQLAGAGNHGPEDIAWAELTNAKSALVLGRNGRPFRFRERRQLGALVRIADSRIKDLPF